MSDIAASSTEIHIFLGRQPILGRNQQLLAYELFFRNGMIVTENRADILATTQTSTTIMANAFAERSISDSLGPYRGFINVDANFLCSDLIEALPSQLVVLEILGSIEPTPEIVARCQQLHVLGFTLALNDVTRFSTKFNPLFELADIVKINIAQFDAEQLSALVSQIKPFGKKLLAENVETREQLVRCQQLGFDLFQGYFFAHPSIIGGHRLNPSQAGLIRLFSLVMEDADTREIENTFKQDPGLTINLLRLINSASSGLSTRITSLRHAITLMGRRQLQRWLQLLIYTGAQGSASHGNSPLLQLAATRGRMMELLAERLQTKNSEFSDQAFMVGIMSLMPTLLSIAMPDILDQLPVAPRVHQALTDYGGQYGLLLRLVEATEQTDASLLCEALKSLPGISRSMLDTALSQALSWANHLNLETT